MVETTTTTTTTTAADDLEVFKIGRMRVVFPPDVTEDELQFTSMILYSYIQTVKYKTISKDMWSIKNRLEQIKDREKKENSSNSNQAGVS